MSVTRSSSKARLFGVDVSEQIPSKLRDAIEEHAAESYMENSHSLWELKPGKYRWKKTGEPFEILGIYRVPGLSYWVAITREPSRRFLKPDRVRLRPFEDFFGDEPEVGEAPEGEFKPVFDHTPKFEPAE